MDNAAFSDFRIVQELGRGSFGTVYKALWRPPSDHRERHGDHLGGPHHEGSSSSSQTIPGAAREETVVLKRIDFRPWHQERHRHAAKKEVHMLSKVQHPNIIRYFGSFSHKGSLFICMEYANCGDLHRLVQKRQKKQAAFSEDQLWKFSTQLVAAIAHLHLNHIIHRDLKPLNVFLSDPGDTIKVNYKLYIRTGGEIVGDGASGSRACSCAGGDEYSLCSG